MTCRVFISFATGDDDYARQLSDSLSRLEHVEVYVPDWIEVKGKNMDYKVKEGLDSARVAIVIITFNSTNTIWLNQEIGYAFARTIPVILVVEKGIALKGFLEGQDFITYQRGDFKQNIYQVISRLRKVFTRYLLEYPIEKFYVICPICNKKFLESLPAQEVISQTIEDSRDLSYTCQFCSNSINVEPSTLSSIIS